MLGKLFKKIRGAEASQVVGGFVIALGFGVVLGLGAGLIAAGAVVVAAGALSEMKGGK
jgi:hypothetical protein